MPRKYTIQQKKPGAPGYLLEDGSQIARITSTPNDWPMVKFKWYSERARDRFCGYSDSISMEECVEALGFLR